ncbi:MAG TPA: AMP-binding protein [Acidimicrobiales bacterium]|nr:AMP-binding protein [Acidimicrobiales bacterium]
MIDLTAIPKKVGAMLDRGAAEVRSVGVLARAGVIGWGDPKGALASLKAMNGFGAVGGGIVTAATRHGSRTGLIDDLGSLTFIELHERSNALADGLAARGVPEGATIGLFARNHRGLLDATFGAAKGGYRLLLLNTDFAAPQAKGVCEREGVDVLIVDEEFLGVVADIDVPHGTIVAWTDTESLDGRVDGHDTLDAIIASADVADRPAPSRHGTIVILTSGTTGMPKGAPRSQPKALSGPGAVLSKIPFREAGRVLVAPPIFHSWGLLTALLAVSTGSTVIVTRRFDPTRALDLLEEHRCTGLIVVPVMLNRMLAVEERPPPERELSGLTFIAASGSKIEPSLALATMDAFGDVLYNFYGSTEVASAAIATPEDLRANPASAGRPPLGSTVRLYDTEGREVPVGETGRIFVGNSMSFSGYTGGGDKDRIGDLVATGDVGHWDSGGRLVVDGRDDDMIVSGGENVFPGEVEDLIADLDAVAEVAVIGVDDATMGQRLQAFVVVQPDQILTEAEVRDHVKANLARYKVPRSVSFLDELPRNPTGKVLKRELRSMV